MLHTGLHLCRPARPGPALPPRAKSRGGWLADLTSPSHCTSTTSSDFNAPKRGWRLLGSCLLSGVFVASCLVTRGYFPLIVSSSAPEEMSLEPIAISASFLKSEWRIDTPTYISVWARSLCTRKCIRASSCFARLRYGREVPFVGRFPIRSAENGWEAGPTRVVATPPHLPHPFPCPRR